MSADKHSPEFLLAAACCRWPPSNARDAAIRAAAAIVTNLPGSGNFTSSSEPGWTAGAGVEAAFADNWTARIEYLYVDLENASQTVAGTTGTFKFDASLIRLGVDYKFR